jgi:hypothetical protein
MQGQCRFLRPDQMMILDIVQIGLPETGQKMRRKSSAAKMSISLCEARAPNRGALA